MYEIKGLLSQIINSLGELVQEEQFLLYSELYSTYSSALVQFEQSNSASELEKNIRWTTRMLLEATPNNTELGLKILDEIKVLNKAINIV